ncbi:hypothetical protein PV327_006896 [Microctonus hyperodae]|uniref:C2H2-type domain-containing protein n=1 Tax=Microctonus hyperodae TaxID=165561 RepID=A0AA39F574_MICHY|nr:hypothetical protein PV327_006896 [Microctonus hyperodae]
MNEETILVNTPNHFINNMNDSQFSFKTLSPSNIPNTLIDCGSLIDVKEIDTDIASRHVKDDDDDDLIPIVCLDGVVYAFQNGQLSELDLCKLENDNDSYEKTAVILSSDNSEIGNEIPIKDECDRGFYESDNQNVNLTITEKEHLEKCDIIPEKNTIYDKNTLNANDFVEVVAAFKCKICPFTSQDRGQLLNHFESIHASLPNKKKNNEQESNDKVTTNDVKLVYMCGECSNCFPSMESCREHMINDHQLMDRVACDKINDDSSLNNSDVVDNRSTSNNTTKIGRLSKKSKVVSSEYEKNKKSIHIKERNVKCLYRGCLHKFTTEKMMQKHVIYHGDTQNMNIFKCNICDDVKFTKWKACCLHLWKKHEIDIDMLSCTICNDYKSVTSVKLSTHMRVHSDSRDYECRDCGKRFKQSSQLRNHRIMHLDRKTVDTPRWYTSKTCEMCGKTYADSKCLKNHIQAVHSKLRPYVCNVCGHASARKAMLQMHLRQHTGDKPFNCDICDFKTGDHNSLRRHIMRHTGVRPYKCPHCSYSAIQSSSYKNHLRSKHPSSSGLFTCKICPFITVKKESYTEHMSDHEKGLIKTNPQKNDDTNVEVFPGNIAAAQLIYSCLGAFSEVGKTIEASLMSSSTSVDGTLQTITIQIPSTHLEGSLPMTTESTIKNNNNTTIEQEDDETMHCFLKIPYEEEENIDTGGITIPADLGENDDAVILNVES